MDQTETLSESEVISEILKGRKSLFEKVVRKYNSALYKVGRSYGFNHDDTMDLMQETFISAYLALKSFEGRSSLKTWLIRIMLNNCYKMKHKTSSKNEIVSDVSNEAKPLFTGTNNSTESVVNNRELAKIIEKMLGKIRFDYRMVFSLREVSGLSVADTAELLDISESNVKVRLNRAKSMLRQEIEKEYSLSDLFEFNLKYCDVIVNNVMKKIYEL